VGGVGEEEIGTGVARDDQGIGHLVPGLVACDLLAGGLDLGGQALLLRRSLGTGGDRSPDQTSHVTARSVSPFADEVLIDPAILAFKISRQDLHVAVTI